MNNRLLITLGDSWTEGVGCYEKDLLKQFQLGLISTKDLYIKSIPRFKKEGWPPRLAKKLNADLINLGHGGASNSGEAKRLITKNNLYGLRKKYNEVLLIFLISDPGRFSFYSGGEILDIRLNDKTCLAWEVAEPYVTHVIKDVFEDTFKETAFYLKIVENFCKLNDYIFFYGSAFSNMKILDKYFTHTNNLHFYDKHNRTVNYGNLLKDEMWAHCNHPNELGYEFMAVEMYEKIKQRLGKFE